MAGIPQAVIRRAKDVLKLLELKDLSFQNDLNRENSPQMSLFQETEPAIIKKLKNADVNAMTPLEALNFLADLKSGI
jgi:DNA mismatch repair ATPase MutS